MSNAAADMKSPWLPRSAKITKESLQGKQGAKKKKSPLRSVATVKKTY